MVEEGVGVLTTRAALERFALPVDELPRRFDFLRRVFKRACDPESDTVQASDGIRVRNCEKRVFYLLRPSVLIRLSKFEINFDGLLLFTAFTDGATKVILIEAG